LKSRPATKLETTALETTERAKPDLKEYADLGDELAKYIGTLKLERDTKEQISRLVYQVQAALSKPLELDPRRLSKLFPNTDSAVLVDGEKLLVRQGKKETAVSLLELEPDPYFAVVKEVGAAVVRLLKEDEARRSEGIKPLLQVSTKLRGRELALFDFRSYALLLSNTGGAARKVKISLSTDSGEWYGPFDVDGMETKELEVRHVHRILKSKAFKIAIRCEDGEGRKYAGEVEAKPNSKAARAFKLEAAE
jgi:hypothetical protein